MLSLRLFVSSPGDVDEDRRVAARVIERLRYECSASVALEPYFWEHEPLRATQSFQEQIPLPSEADAVICILWSRLGTRLPAHITRRDGSRYASGTEFEFEIAAEAYRDKGAPELLVYRKTARPITEIESEEQVLERLAQKKALDAFVERWFQGPEGELQAAFHAYKTSARFEDLLEEHLRRLIERRLRQQPAAGEAAPPQRSWWRGSPYRGLETFGFDDSPIFCGRIGAVSGVLDTLRRRAAAGRPFVLLVGASGCGKSSLMRAGVLPTLTCPGVIAGIGLWRRAMLRPGDAAEDLMRGLAAALLDAAALPELAAAGSDEEELTRLLHQAPQGVAALVRSTLAQVAESVQAAEKLEQPPRARLVLAIDQLEELLTDERIDPPAQRAWLATIAALIEGGRLWVIATLRSDFYDRASEIPELVELKEGGGQFDLLAPGPAEIGRLIRQPALMAGLRFAEDPRTGERLDDVLRDAAAAAPDALPLLEFTLDQLYRRRDGDTLTFDAYRELGGLEGALAQHAEEVYSSLAAPAKAALPGALAGLVGLGLERGSRVARRRMPRAALEALDGGRALIDAFAAARLLVVDRSAEASAEVSVVHEALLQHWPRLRDWIGDNEERLRARARLASAAAIWDQRQRGSDFLLPRGALAEARGLVEGESAAPTELERAFYVASRDHHAGRHRRRLALATAVLITLLGGTLAYLDAYVFDHVEYHAAVVRRWGVPEGAAPVSADAARRRASTYRLVHRGRWGRLTHMETVNGHGQRTAERVDVDYLYDGMLGRSYAGLLNQQECSWELAYDQQGRLIELAARNRLGRLVYRVSYLVALAGATTVTADYRGPRGLPMPRTASGATLVEITRSAEGFDLEHRYLDLRRRPVPDHDGSFGLDFEVDADGRVSAVQLIGRDGEPHLGRDGFAQARFEYDEQHRRIGGVVLDLAGQPVFGDEGCAAWRRQRDRYGNIVESKCLGPAGEPAPQVDGVHGSRYRFDDAGNLLEESFFDATGQLATSRDGYARWTGAYDDRGQQTDMILFGADGAPAYHRDGYHRVSWSYDGSGNIVEEAYFGADGQPTLGRDGYARRVAEFDDAGNETRVELFDVDGRPAVHRDGYHRRDRRYDERGKVVEEAFFDSAGESIVVAEGHHLRRVTHDERGNELQTAYFGVDGQPAVITAGYATLRRVFDELGREIERSHFGVDGEPALTATGYHRLTRQLDDGGWAIVESHFGTSGEPVARSNGTHSHRFTRDNRGLVISKVYFDVAGEPTSTNYGAGRIDSRYDAAGRLTGQSYYDPQGRPVATENGYAVLEQRYDDRGNIVEGRFLGADGQLVALRDGYAGWRSVYDDRGNQLEITFFGLDEQPVRTLDGYATLGMQFDAHGNATLVRCFDFRRQAVEHREGYHAARSLFDFRGLEVRREFFDTAGEPAEVADGFHGWEERYDSRGRSVERLYFGVDAAPVVSRDGYAGYRQKRDALGHVIETTYLGRDRRPMVIDEGYAIWRARRDARGNLLEQAYFGPGGEPALHSDGNHSFRSSYDGGGNEIELTFLDAAGQPVVISDGYARRTKRYDPRGNLLEVAYFDATGQPALRRGGYHIALNRYDAAGDLIEQSYRDTAGRPVTASDDYARLVLEHDAHRRPAGGSFRDGRGRLVLGPQGWARMTRRYDRRGQEVEQAYFGLRDEPVAGPDGWARVASRFDARGYRTEVSWYGPEGDPFVVADGYARLVAAYDDAGQVTEAAYFGAAGEPVIGPGRFARKTTAFDPSGRAIEVAFFAPDGAAMTSDDGFARFAIDFDAAARREEGKYTDPDGQLVAAYGGLARWVTLYDANGLAVDTTYYGADGRPATGPDGFARRAVATDDAGRPLEERYFDAAGQPTRHRLGWAKVRVRYADDGSAQRLYLDLEDRPLELRTFIAAVIPGGQAEALGLQPGDVVVRYGETPIGSSATLAQLVRETGGERRQLVVQRGASLVEYAVEPGPLGIRLEDAVAGND